jgi:hypothetical protein
MKTGLNMKGIPITGTSNTSVTKSGKIKAATTLGLETEPAQDFVRQFQNPRAEWRRIKSIANLQAEYHSAFR